MFSSLLRAAVGTVLLPVDLAADVVTLGGALTDRRRSHTGKRLRDVSEALQEITD